MIHFILALSLLLPVASSEHLKDPDSKQAKCSMYANNFTAGAWSKWKGIPKVFKNLPREKYEMIRQEHSMLPADSMYIINLDSLSPDRQEVVKGQMLDGYKMMEENIGHLHGQEPDWRALTENIFNVCMNGDPA